MARTLTLRRVVVTGMGLVSCLGNTLDAVSQALRNGRSGIRQVDEYVALGLGSRIAGVPSLVGEPAVERKLARFMGDTALYAYHAARQALADAQLAHGAVTSERTGVVIGSGVSGLADAQRVIDTLRQHGTQRIAPYAVPRAMSSTASACVATALGVRGVSYSPSSACTTSTNAIGQALDLIQFGRQDVVLAGGAEELYWGATMMFDVMGALSNGFNATPTQASRPYDVARDGFVLAAGGGVLVLESLDHAVARGAHIYAELTGYGSCSEGADMVAPTAAGMARAMRLALATHSGHIDYLNTHAPSTQRGDLEELLALREVFGAQVPPFSSTKGMTGHALGACGVHDAIYTLLMMRDSFIAAGINLDTPDPQLSGMPIVQHSRAAELDTVMSNNFGFGGTYASLIFQRYQP